MREEELLIHFGKQLVDMQERFANMMLSDLERFSFKGGGYNAEYSKTLKEKYKLYIKS